MAGLAAIPSVGSAASSHRIPFSLVGILPAHIAFAELHEPLFSVCVECRLEARLRIFIPIGPVALQDGGEGVGGIEDFLREAG